MKPHVVVLGGNFAGLGSAQKIRETCGDSVRITVIDRKNYLLFIPNIPAEVFEDRDPSKTLKMDIASALDEDGVEFLQAEIKAIDPDKRQVDFIPNERPGSAPDTITYDYLVVAVGNRLAYDKIEGFAEHGHTVSDFYYGNKLRHFLANDYKGGPIAVGSARFHKEMAPRISSCMVGMRFRLLKRPAKARPLKSCSPWLPGLVDMAKVGQIKSLYLHPPT